MADAGATHSWGGYHWARVANPFALKLADNVNTGWDVYLAIASNDWTVSSVLDTVIVTGSANPKNCRPTSGQVDVCNAKYGNNGWLGMAQVWLSGSHIAQGAVKMNDTYFNSAQYNTPAWHSLVLCQEIGHTLGLDHQDENFNNAPLGTCMDYSNDPVPNQHPNAHDYEELVIIYSHLDASSTVAAMPASVAQAALDSPMSWGKLIKSTRGGMLQRFERDFGGDHKIVTFVIWADRSAPRE